MPGFTSGDARQMDVALRGFTNLNHSIRTQEVVSDFTLNPDQVDPARDVTYGDQNPPVTYNSAKGGYELTGEQAVLESARLIRYRPGGILIAGQKLVVDAAPTAGVFEAGIGRVVDETTTPLSVSDSEVFLRLDSDGDYSLVIKRNDVETIIPRNGPDGSWTGDKATRSWKPDDDKAGTIIDDENGDLSGRYWGIDVFDGSGPDAYGPNPSGIGIDPPASFLTKLEGTYYGKGPFVAGFEGVGPGGIQRPWPAVVFESAQQSIINQPTQPLFARYDDQGAGNTETFEVYGRQGSHVGEFQDTPITPWHLIDTASWSGPNTTIAAAELDNADLILAYRRKPDSAVAADTNYAGTEFGLLNIDSFLNQRSVFFLSLDPDFGTQTPAWGTVNGVNDDDLASIQVATEDGDATALTADAATGRRFGGEIVGAGKNRDTLAGLDPVSQPNPRNTPVGLFAISLTGSDETDAEVKVKFSVNA